MTTTELKKYIDILSLLGKSSHGKYKIEYKTKFMKSPSIADWVQSNHRTVWISPKNMVITEHDMVDWNNVTNIYVKNKEPEYFL